MVETILPAASLPEPEESPNQAYLKWRREVAQLASAWINNTPFKAVLENGNVKLVQIHQPEGLQATNNGERV